MNHQDLFNELIGMPVSHVWFSDYSVFFIELGVLTPSEHTRRDGSLMNPYGQMTIYAGFDWRIERKRSIFCSKSSTRKRREVVCQSFVGTTITEATCFGRLLELQIGFSNGLWLMTFEISPGQPRWSIGFKDRGIHLSSKRGNFITEPSVKT